MKWIGTGDEGERIPVNVNLLIYDGVDVFVGFYDSMHEWRLSDQTSCESICFCVFYWMEFPDPPEDLWALKDD